MVLPVCGAVLCLFTLYVKQGEREDYTYPAIYIVTQLLLILILSCTHLMYEQCNRLLLNNMCMLLGIGIIMLTRLATTKAVRQLMIMTVSFLLGLLVVFLMEKGKNFRKMGILYLLVGVLLLAVVLVLGNVTSGSKLSLTFRGITFQPSEPVKLLFCFT